MQCTFSKTVEFLPVSKAVKEWFKINVLVWIKEGITAVPCSFILFRFMNFFQIVHYVLHFAFRDQFFEFIVWYYTWKIYTNKNME